MDEHGGVLRVRRDEPRLGVSIARRRRATGPPVVVGELVGGDPEQPRTESAGLPAIPVEAAKGALEGGRGDVLGRLDGTRPAIGECMDPGR